MRRTRWLGLIVFAFVVIASAQDRKPKPAVSKDPLTQDQIDVYRAVLRVYVKGSDGALNLSNTTVPLGRENAFWDDGCVKSLRLEPDPKTPVVHLLDPTVALSPKMVLVDPKTQAKTVKQNDPQNVLISPGNASQEHTEKQLDEAVNKAFRTGLFTFSEIVFDKEHNHAVLMYSFYCGMLCGHGNMVVLKKVDKEWKVERQCGGWIS